MGKVLKPRGLFILLRRLMGFRSFAAFLCVRGRRVVCMSFC